MKKCSNRANDIVVFVYFIALSELFEDGPLALSGKPVVTAYTSMNAIGKLVVCKYHELSFPRSDFPHWLCAAYVDPKPIIYSFCNMITNITAV